MPVEPATDIEPADAITQPAETAESGETAEPSAAAAEPAETAETSAAAAEPGAAAAETAEPGAVAPETGAVAAEPGASAVESPEAAAAPGPGAPLPPVDAAEVGKALKALFPALFAGPPKPIKLKIQADIQQRAAGRFGKAALSAFFRRYTASTGYLLAVSKSPHRFDLDGQPAGDIAPEHRKAAVDELARRRTNREEREQLALQQRRNRARLLDDFERTTLTRANFCVLKGVADAELDALLALAREERNEATATRQAPPVPRRADPPARRPLRVERR